MHLKYILNNMIDFVNVCLQIKSNNRCRHMWFCSLVVQPPCNVHISSASSRYFFFCNFFHTQFLIILLYSAYIHIYIPEINGWIVLNYNLPTRFYTSACSNTFWYSTLFYNHNHKRIKETIYIHLTSKNKWTLL